MIMNSVGIGQFNEGPLHAALKARFAPQPEATEVRVAGYVIDVIQDGCLVEIQTRRLGAMRRKLERLLPDHQIRLIHPIALERWIVRHDDQGAVLSRRKSPQRGGVLDIFAELTSLPHLVADPHLTLEVLLIREEQVRIFAGERRWRRKGWSVQERRLLAIVEQHTFTEPADFAALLPTTLPTPFTTAHLAAAAGIPRRLAQQMAYCLRQMAMIRAVGKAGNAVLYDRP
jgi:hypothetical protein